MSFMHAKRLFFHANSQASIEQLISLCQSHELGNFAINFHASRQSKFMKKLLAPFNRLFTANGYHLTGRDDIA